ncbi:MAG TPA: DUF3472 domain-containing protein [Verrucomicrobiae bacterium]|nr:DUF3472 domain-containing protein [Verrucomicrobiae bacterium]
MKRHSFVAFAAFVLTIAQGGEFRAARSVHLVYPAPGGALFYNEVVVEKSVNGSYFMACGWNTGYFGIQQLGGTHDKLVLFSVWDPTKGDNPNGVKAEDRVEVLYQGEGVQIKRFGGEGTGAQCLWRYDWRLDETNHFLVGARIEGEKTTYAAWFRASDGWKKLACFRTRTGGLPLSGYYSFIEDFRRDGKSAGQVRKARFGNGWIKTPQGQWVRLAKARFTASGAEWESKENIDAGSEDGFFFLATGGEVKRTRELRSFIDLPVAATPDSPGFLPAFPSEASNAAAEWVPLCPGGGGWCMGIYPHATNPNVIWMNTDISGLFKSTDGGTTYKLVSGAIHLATGGGSVVCGNYSQFAVDPASPSICYYAVHTLGRGVHENGLWKSIDEGETWSYIPGTEALLGASLAVGADETLYCAQKDSHKIHVSTDQGKTFAIKETLPFTAANVKDYQSGIHLFGSKSGRLYAASPLRPATGLYYTDDKGDHWQSVAALADKRVGAISCSPSDPNLVFAVTAEGAIYRALDGKTFEPCAGKLAPRRVDSKRSVGVGISNSGRVVAWAQGMSKPILSDDNGQTFSDAKVRPPLPGDYLFFANGLRDVTSFAASPCGDRFYKTASGTVWRSIDNGETWEPRVTGIDVLCLEAPPVVDAADPNRVYFLAGDVGFYYTTDLGKSWKISGGIDATWCQAAALAQDPTDSDVLYRVWSPINSPEAPCYLYKSIDRGLSWSQTPTANVGSRYREMGSLIVDPTNPRHIYFSSTQNSHRNPPLPDSLRAVLESTDGGNTFHRMPGSPGELHQMSRARSGNLYGVDGIWGGPIYEYSKMTRQGTALYPKGATDVAVDSTNEKVILVADFLGGKLMLSTDGGATWTAKKDWQGRDICAWAVYIDPVRPQVMLAGAHNIKGGAGGILRSLDGGQTWSSFQPCGAPAYVNGFVYGGVPGRVYAWTCMMGSFKVENAYSMPTSP